MSTRETRELVGEMGTEFEAPELTVIGDAREVVQGVPRAGSDFHGFAAPDFEFESDEAE